jgi:chromate reductase, NAD(P)H dehydrogenase (quinone)
MTKVLAISGSLRRLSYNTGLLEAAMTNAPEGVDIELYQELESLPPYNEDKDTDTPPPAVAELRRRITEADAILISTPEYNTTMPGQMKQVVDWASRPYGPGAALYSKPVAVVGVSVTDYGALWAQDHLRKALAIAGARLTDIDLSVGGAQTKFNEHAKLTDPETLGRLEEVLSALVSHHRSLVA